MKADTQFQPACSGRTVGRATRPWGRAPCSLLLLIALLLPVKVYAEEGLDELDDERLLLELAGRGLTTLLEHAFERQQVPEDKRRAIRTLIALRDLADSAEPMTAAERQRLIRQSVEGIDRALPHLRDPDLMMRQAMALIEHAIEPQVNILEYWGENARTQAALRPVAEAVIRMLEKAAAEAAAAADAVAERLRGPDDPAIGRWIELDNLAALARYTRHMVDYYHVLSIDRASPRRSEIAAAAVDYLAQFDNPDSQVQPLVRNRIAKLHMARGQYDRARELFHSVATNPDGSIQPPPDVAQQYEARYFAAVCDLMQQQPAAARQGLAQLIAWQERNLLQADPEALSGAAAAAAMLEYRIHALEAELATDDAQRAHANDAALGVLVELVRQRPDLRDVIYEQLTARLPAEADVRELEPLLLAALIQRGDMERLKPAEDPVDRAAMDQAVAAASEMIARRDGDDVGDEQVDAAAILLPLFLQRLDQPVEAAEAFLDYIEQFEANEPNRQLALEHALALIGQMLRERPEDPATLRLYERFLPIAIAPPFERKEFAYEYARRLQATGRHEEAIGYFRQVPAEDARLVDARFFEMTAIRQHLDTDLEMDAPQRRQWLARMLELAEEVMRGSRTAMRESDAHEQARYRAMLARTVLLAAEMSQADPERVLALLEDFETTAAGLAGEADLLPEALLLRVNAQMALGRNAEAAEGLVRLLGKRPGGQGAGIVFNLLRKLEEDLEAAEGAEDRARARELARGRAMLSGFLVEWAERHEDESIRRYTYRYRVFDAAAQHLAARLEEDDTARRRRLEEALARYRLLMSEPGAALYRQTTDEGDADPSAPDPAVMLGVAMVQFDLGNYAEAQPLLGRLLAERRLGPPRRIVHEDGRRRVVENDQYWEATYKLLRSNVELAAAGDAGPEALEAARNHLKLLYIREGAEVGGRTWREHFEQLRLELIPEFEVE